jgi:hypothetical protein
VSPRLAYNFENVAELVNAAPVVLRAQPGEQVQYTLYWQARQPAERPLQVFLRSISPDGAPLTSSAVIATRQRAICSPPTGKPGQTWAETYILNIPEDAPPQTVYLLVAGLYESAALRPLTAQNTAGEEVLPIVGRLAIAGPMAAAHNPPYRLGEHIGLGEPELAVTESQIDLCLQWSALAEMDTNYTLFVHVLDDTGQIIAQHDSPPRRGDYPTSVWSVGESVSECLEMDLPRMPEQISLGLYGPDGTRLPIQTTRSDALILNDSLILNVTP